MADKTVRLLVNISGTRDGKDWPKAGQTVSLPEDEANVLLSQGMAAAPDAEEEDALADVLGVSTAAMTNDRQGRASVRASMKPAPHADEPQAYHVPVMAGEEPAAKEAQKAADEANKDLGIDVKANEAIRNDEVPTADAPAAPTNKNAKGK